MACYLATLIKFQSTLPREERLGLAGHLRAGLNFNPRSHERSDDNRRKFNSDSCHFNPRSHERSDVFHRRMQKSIYPISIHAPTRGATAASVMREESSQFQSTLPREERHKPCTKTEKRVNISIHAPTRGATITL